MLAWTFDNGMPLNLFKKMRIKNYFELNKTQLHTIASKYKVIWFHEKKTWSRYIFVPKFTFHIDLYNCWYIFALQEGPGE